MRSLLICILLSTALAPVMMAPSDLRASTPCPWSFRFLGHTGDSPVLFLIRQDLAGECEFSVLHLLSVSDTIALCHSIRLQRFQDWDWVDDWIAHFDWRPPVVVRLTHVGEEGWSHPDWDFQVSDPPADAVLRDRFWKEVNEEGAEWSGWAKEQGSRANVLPRVVGRDVELIFSHEGGLYFDYSVESAYYFPLSEHILVFTRQTLGAEYGTPLNGFLLLKITRVWR